MNSLLGLTEALEIGAGGATRELTEQEDQLRRGLITPFGTLLSDVGTETVTRSNYIGPPKRRQKAKNKEEKREEEKEIKKKQASARAKRRERRAYSRPLPSSSSSELSVIEISDEEEVIEDDEASDFNEEDEDFEFLDDTAITEQEATDASLWAEDYAEREEKAEKNKRHFPTKRKRKRKESSDEEIYEEDSVSSLSEGEESGGDEELSVEDKASGFVFISAVLTLPVPKTNGS